MKIALFHDLPSGGAKRTLYEQIRRLSNRHEIDLFSLGCANQDFADIRQFTQRITIVPFSTLPLLKSPLGRLNQGIRTIDLIRLRKVMKALAAEINEGMYDLALVHPCQFTFSPTILRYLRIPSLYYRQDVVRWLHDPPIQRSSHHKSGWKPWLDKIDPLLNTYKRFLIHEDLTSMARATKVVTNSYFVRESLYRIYGIAPDVCYHGVDIDQFHPLKLDRQNFVLSVGMVNPYKGYDFMIECIASMPEEKRPLLVIAYNSVDPIELHYLQDLAYQRSVKVEFKSQITDQVLLELYNRARCVLYTPVMESFGLVPLEAMACATPVVGIREAGVRETILDGYNGLLADRHPAEFAAAISRIIDDPSFATRLGQQARTNVEKHWNWGKAIEKLESYLNEVAATKTGVSM